MSKKIEVGSHVRILKEAPESAAALGRVNMISNGRYHVSCMNMPFAGSFVGFLEESEIEAI